MYAQLVYLIIFATFTWADDPRLANPYVADCTAAVQNYLSASEYVDHRDEVVGACRDVDAKCVSVAGNSLSSEEHGRAATFLPIIRACRGRGVGQCLEELSNHVASFDRRTSKEILKLLKKCE